MTESGITVIEVKENILADNDKEAGKVRAMLKEHGVFLVNLMSSPGAGKTTTLVRTIRALKDKYRIGVIEADVDSDVDASAVTKAGAAAIQIHTGGSCHMDAEMTEKGLERMKLDGLDLIFLENVGNLVCPAEFDVGQNARVMILSVPEGDDKPLKYPLMFQKSDVLVISKTDAMPWFDFDMDACIRRAKRLNPDIVIFPLSAKTGEGMENWENWLLQEKRAWTDDF